MAHATRGIAATFVASTLALAACSGTDDKTRGRGPAENQANLAEPAGGPGNGVVDMPTRDPGNTALQNAPASQELSGNAQ